MAAPKVKLTYLLGRGRAEPLRMLMSIGNIPYEEELLKYEEEFKKIKSSK